MTTPPQEKSLGDFFGLKFIKHEILNEFFRFKMHFNEFHTKKNHQNFFLKGEGAHNRIK
jgi:hypothetical protein